MSVHTMCPVCGIGYDLEDGFRGQWVECKNCRNPFRVVEAPAAPMAAGIADSPPPRAVPSAQPDDGWSREDEWARQPRRRRREAESGGLPVGAIVAIVVGPVVLLVVAVLLIWSLTLSTVAGPVRGNFPVVNNNWPAPQPAFNPRPINPVRINPPFNPPRINPPPIPVRGPGPAPFRR